MRSTTAALAATLALFGTAFAQSRPSDTPICDFYTTALLKENTAKNQYTLLTLLVNTAVIGNYTKPNVGVKVAGILAPGMYNDTAVNLLPYFNGGLASTNDGGAHGVAVNFLDDGGAAPLMNNMPSNGNMASNQYMLLTHLYQYFGVLLGCSQAGKDAAFPKYMGGASQYQIHKFMALDPYEVGYFITQVGTAAASFGVAKEDITVVATALDKLFNHRCSPPTTVVPEQGPQLQAMCIADNCPIAPQATCAAYDKVEEPLVANATLAMGLGQNVTSGANGTITASMGATATGTATMMSGSGSAATATGSNTPIKSAGAAKMVGGMAAGGVAVLAFML